MYNTVTTSTRYSQMFSIINIKNGILKMLSTGPVLKGKILNKFIIILPLNSLLEYKFSAVLWTMGYCTRMMPVVFVLYCTEQCGASGQSHVLTHYSTVHQYRTGH